MKQSTDILTITLEPYTMTDDEDCGNLVYEASVDDSYDPFSVNHAIITDNVLVFENPDEYNAGIMTVKVDIRLSLTTAIAYSIYIPITVIKE